MVKKAKSKRPAAPKLNAAEQQAEATRKALKRSVARAKEIKRLARQLARENDAAQKALLELAHDIADRFGDADLDRKVDAAESK